VEKKEQGGKIGDLLVTPADAATRFETVTGVAMDDVWRTAERVAEEQRLPPDDWTWQPWLCLTLFDSLGLVDKGGNAAAATSQRASRLAVAVAEYMESSFRQFRDGSEYPGFTLEDRAAVAALARELVDRLRELEEDSAFGSTRGRLLRKVLARHPPLLYSVGTIASTFYNVAESMNVPLELPPGIMPRGRPGEPFRWLCMKTAEILWPAGQGRGELDSKASVERVALFVAAAHIRDADTEDGNGLFINLCKLQRTIRMAIYRLPDLPSGGST
jgi:hypothetical protein